MGELSFFIDSLSLNYGVSSRFRTPLLVLSSKLLSHVISLPSYALHGLTRGSAIAEKPSQRFVSVEILLYCCTNNGNRSCVSLRSTFSNYHVLFHYLYRFVHASLYQAQQACSSHQQTSIRPILLMSSGQ